MSILNMIAQGGWGSNVWEPTNISALVTSNSSIDIKWTDNSLQTLPPTTFQKSVLVRKVGSAPTTPSDWTTVVTETVMNTYQSSAYTDTGLTQWTTYYYQVFSYSTDWGITYWTPTSATPQWWNPWVNTIAYWKLETDGADYSWNGYNLTLNWITFQTSWDLEYAEVTTASQYCYQPWVFTQANVWAGDFCLNFWFNPVNPWSSNYPVMFLDSPNYSPYQWINIFFDPHNMNGQWDSVLFRVKNSEQYPSTTTASSLYNWWHNVVYTRLSWVCYAYIDWVSTITPYSDSTNISQLWAYNAYVIWWNTSSQTRKNTWAKFSNIICENIWWSGSDVIRYYNQTKSLYWIS